MIFQRIKEVREKLGFSRQDEFAETIGISFRTYQTYEQGQVKVIPHTFIEKLNKQYNVSFGWLLTGNGLMFEDKVGNKDNFKQELISDIQKLSPKRQEYYYHRIKADLIEEELDN
ncbi:helix-turn-helix domain-containing protein [Aliarcobacter cryaerophilus]|uniref:helix-turn-helix domain-containing protein n=1 Tax=Aliarcobacter cryaerophilus TaxID=28198 RepID=UPI00082EB699|nr:helix-turn-helix transcriptional regulator [Aliarcobacter cryaerophilus]